MAKIPFIRMDKERMMKGVITIFQKLKQMAKQLKSNLIVLYLSYKDPRVPWFTKLFTICVVAYAFSPIDLIPDFIPVLGYLDDLIIVPLGIYIALKLIPPQVIEDNREKAKEISSKPKNWYTATLFIAIWITLFIIVAYYSYKWFL